MGGHRTGESWEPLWTLGGRLWGPQEATGGGQGLGLPFAQPAELRSPFPEGAGRVRLRLLPPPFPVAFLLGAAAPSRIYLAQQRKWRQPLRVGAAVSWRGERKAGAKNTQGTQALGGGAGRLGRGGPPGEPEGPQGTLGSEGVSGQPWGLPPIHP